MNTFGRYFRLTTFGESHGKAIGGTIDGLPARMAVDYDLIRTAMKRRSTVGAAGATSRHEPDDVELLSGVSAGMTLGTPIGFIIKNTDVRSEDYATNGNGYIYRPNHADYTYEAKYGVRDIRGGGRASARETACRVVGGAFAQMLLAVQGIDVRAWTSRIGDVQYTGDGDDEAAVYATATRCPDSATSAAMEAVLEAARRRCDSLGGVVSCRITGVPAGLGEPLFGKLQALLAGAMMSIPAAKGFEYGDGFATAGSCGSEQIDEYYIKDGNVRTRTNHSGGIQGGISNGMPIDFRVAFKPIATMPGRDVTTIDSNGRLCTYQFAGRHDVCAVPRAVAIVKAMALMTIADAVMANKVATL